MAGKVAAAALQYSKWLSRFICYVWASYRLGVLIASIIAPTAADALASTLSNLDWIMLVNEGTYLINSLGEKYIYSDRFIFKWLSTGGFKQMMQQVTAFNKKRTQEIKEEVEEDETEEEHDNG